MKIDFKDYRAAEGKKYRKIHELLLLCIKFGMIDFFEPYAFNKTKPNGAKRSEANVTKGTRFFFFATVVTCSMIPSRTL